MQVKTKGRVAVTAMVDLALRGTGGPVALRTISRRQGISMSYLEQLFARLRRHEFVDSIRGPGGGYRLSRPADEITVADIVAAVDDAPDERIANMAGAGAEPANRLVTQNLSASVDAWMANYLSAISLKSLADAQLASGVLFDERPRRLGILPKVVVQPTRVRGPNSVFALGDALAQSSITG